MIQNRMKKIQEIQHSVEKRKTFSSLYSRPHKNWTEISIDSDVNVLPMNRALTLVKKTHETLSKKLSQTALKFVQKFAESSGSDTDRGAADNPEQNEEDSGDPALSRDEKERLKTVGVFVDYEEGLVSFYDVGSRSHIYSFTGQTFTNKLYPYFFPGICQYGINTTK
ncbi:E3 ubiquitin- ligase TRIM39-like protein [Labeo rohita]|uniref:E3 ubiquitin-ligase TRIM39-like protein n=1 Tax=Labeo rohita TaxID=84645 RepID=A0A498MXJ3_LABRO|nr:E3 ubiquitin- ligase TRIM39-like protein [Labeo rohita]